MVRMSTPFTKLATNTLVGLDPDTGLWKDVTAVKKALLEVDQRWISERVGFNARRVLLTSDPIPSNFSAVRIKGDDVEHLLYSQQRAVRGAAVYLYDYTVMDKTDDAVVVTFVAAEADSGLSSSLTETESVVYPIHMVRVSETTSLSADSVSYARLFAFIHPSAALTVDNELRIGTDYFRITEVTPELNALRLSLTKR